MPSPANLNGRILLDHLDHLITELKDGQVSSIRNLAPLLSTGLLGPQAISVASSFNNLLRWCKENMALGNANAFFLASHLCLAKASVQSNHLEQRITYLEKAISLGNAAAMTERAELYITNSPPDIAKGIALCEQAILLKDPSAMVLRGLTYLEGIGGPIDYTKAIEYFEKAIPLGCPRALSLRALMYEKGLGSPVAIDKAIDFNQKAAHLNDPFGTRNLARIYRNCRQYDKAIVLLDAGIALGDKRCICDRALMYQKAQGGPPDFDKAIALHELGIKKEYAPSILERALMYQNGQGSSVDLTKAARLLRRLVALDPSYMKYLTGVQPLPVIYLYHAYMHENRVEEVFALLATQPNLIDEFIEFDCTESPMRNTVTLTHLHDFIRKYVSISNNKSQINDFLFLVLEKLDQCEKNLGCLSAPLINLKKDCLKQLTIDDLPAEAIVRTMELAINTWYANSHLAPLDQATTQLIASLLKQCIGRVLSCSKEKECQELLPSVAVIVGKSLYREKYNLRAVNFDVSFQDVLTLITATYELSGSHPPSLSNRGLFKEPPTQKVEEQEATVQLGSEHTLN